MMTSNIEVIHVKSSSRVTWMLLAMRLTGTQECSTMYHSPKYLLLFSLSLSLSLFLFLTVSQSCLQGLTERFCSGCFRRTTGQLRQLDHLKCVLFYESRVKGGLYPSLSLSPSLVSLLLSSLSPSLSLLLFSSPFSSLGCLNDHSLQFPRCWHSSH